MTTDNQSLPPLPVPSRMRRESNGYKSVVVQAYHANQMREYGDARAAHARKQALEEAAKACYSASHHWNGLPELALFDVAAKLRGMK